MGINKWSFEGQKASYYAKKRDYQRSKLSQGKRDRAWDDAGKLVKEAEDIQAKKDREVERKQKPEGRDEAMNTAISEMRQDMSIKKLVL